jgi:copper homeostasis protein (lipoprotein)
MRYCIIIFLFIASCTTINTDNSTPQDDSMSQGIPDSHNSRNSVDWNGTYTGIIPCVDCPGRYMMIMLKADQTFTIMIKKLGKSDSAYTASGNFDWNEEGSHISLSTKTPDEEMLTFKVGENSLMIPENSSHKLVKNSQKLTNRYWKLIEVRGQEIITPEDQPKEPHFILLEQDSVIVGNSGCNSFRGMYELSDNNRLRFSNIASTRMACMDVSYENDFLQSLENSDNYTMNSKGDTLSLNRARMAPLARFVASIPK